MEEVREFQREVARVRRVLLRERLRTGLAWWAVGMGALIGLALWGVAVGVAPDRARRGVGLGAAVGLLWVCVDLLWDWHRLRRANRLGPLLRGHLPGIRYAVETLALAEDLPERFVPGASRGLLAAEARRAAGLLRQIRSDWFPPPASRAWSRRAWYLLWAALGVATVLDLWGVSRALGTLLGLPGGPGGVWWAGPPRTVDGIAYDLEVRVGVGDPASENLVPWTGAAADVLVPVDGVVEVTGRLFTPAGALEMVIRTQEGGLRRIPLAVDGVGRFAVRLRPEGDATWYLAAWTPPGEVVQEAARRRFRVAPLAPPSLTLRPSGWMGGRIGESVTVSWWASAPVTLGEVEARYQYPWTEEARPTGVALRHSREAGREAEGVFPVVLGEDLLERGGVMSLWVEAAGLSPGDRPGGRSETLHLYVDVPLTRRLVLLVRMDSMADRWAGLFGEVLDLPGPGDPVLPGAVQGRFEDLARVVRGEAVRLAVQPEARGLRAALEKAAGRLEEALEVLPARRGRTLEALEAAMALVEDALARERISLLADQVGDLERFAGRLARGKSSWKERDWSLLLRTGRWQVGGLEATRLSLLRRTPAEATGRRMALADLGARHLQLQERLSRVASGSGEEVPRALEAAREVAGRWRRLFAEGALTHVRDILLPGSMGEDLGKAFSLQERVAMRTGAVAARVRARMAQREAVPAERVAEWRQRLGAAAGLLRQAAQPGMNPYDLEDVQALERQARFLSELLEAGDIDRAAVAVRQLLGMLESLAASFREALAEDPEGTDPETGAYRRALSGLGKAVEEVRWVHRSLREEVSSREDLLTGEDRGEVADQARMQREALRVFGRVADPLRRLPGVEGSEVPALAQAIRGSMREAVDRLARQEVTAAEAYQQQALEVLGRLRSLLTRRDLDSFRGQEPARFWDEVRLAGEPGGRSVAPSWAAEVRRRLEQGLSGPDAETARSYYESLLAP